MKETLAEVAGDAAIEGIVSAEKKVNMPAGRKVR